MQNSWHHPWETAQLSPLISNPRTTSSCFKNWTKMHDSEGQLSRRHRHDVVRVCSPLYSTPQPSSNCSVIGRQCRILDISYPWETARRSPLSQPLEQHRVVQKFNENAEFLRSAIAEKPRDVERRVVPKFENGRKCKIIKVSYRRQTAWRSPLMSTLFEQWSLKSSVARFLCDRWHWEFCIFVQFLNNSNFFEDWSLKASIARFLWDSWPEKFCIFVEFWNNSTLFEQWSLKASVAQFRCHSWPQEFMHFRRILEQLDVVRAVEFKVGRASRSFFAIADLVNSAFSSNFRTTWRWSRSGI